ncbi:MAG: homoserine dehydrogenase, partial [Pseudomonadota bacterium]
NYILTRMETGRLAYTEVLAEADAQGYLEADPNHDVGGIDAAHKLVILSAISFGTQVDFAGARLQGISEITIEDIIAARDMGYRIKLLGLAQMTDAGLEQSMMPCLVPYNSPLGQLEGGTNMVVIEGDAVGQVVLRGAGAGAGPTASAVLGDVVDIARGAVVPIFGSPAKDLVAARPAQSSTPSNWYIRLRLRDAPGVLAKVAGALGAQGVSIDRLRQQAHQPGEAAPVLIVTHPAAPASVEAALAAIEGTDDSAAAPIALRIVEV